MKKIASFVIMLGLGVAPAFAATSYHNVSLLDVGCSKKAASSPDAHTRSCAIMCAKSGYGILTSDNHFLKFDAKGNQEILKELKASKETDHLRVNVTGDVKGDTLTVSSVKLL